MSGLRDTTYRILPSHTPIHTHMCVQTHGVTSKNATLHLLTSHLGQPWCLPLKTKGSAHGILHSGILRSGILRSGLSFAGVSSGLLLILPETYFLHLQTWSAKSTASSKRSKQLQLFVSVIPHPAKFMERLLSTRHCSQPKEQYTREMPLL